MKKERKFYKKKKKKKIVNRIQYFQHNVQPSENKYIPVPYHLYSTINVADIILS